MIISDSVNGSTLWVVINLYEQYKHDMHYTPINVTPGESRMDTLLEFDEIHFTPPGF